MKLPSLEFAGGAETNQAQVLGHPALSRSEPGSVQT